MTTGTRLIAGLILSAVCFMPLTASAINPPTTDIETEDPVTENPVTEDPVTENPPGNDEELRRKAEDRLSKEKEDRVRDQPKKVVTVPGGNTTTTRVYPVPSRANYCPNGLQPVTISGVISCGAPNQAITYGQMLQHPEPRRAPARQTTYHRSAVPACTPGLKGCVDR